MMAKITINGTSYSSKKVLIQACKDVLYGNKIGTALTGSDFDLINNVLKLHHDYDNKVGSSSYDIIVGHCQVNAKNNMFYINRSDGTSTDFSFYKCILPQSKVTKVKRSLKDTIRLQMMGYKGTYFEDHGDAGGILKFCVSGESVCMSNSHLDHYPKQFDEIVYDWFIINKLNVEDIELVPAGDWATAATLKDTKLEKSFRLYHKKVAKYRVVTSNVNLTRGRAKIKLP